MKSLIYNNKARKTCVAKIGKKTATQGWLELRIVLHKLPIQYN
jgi:hypothetical protein